MIAQIPGTLLPMTAETAEDVGQMLRPMFAALDGVTLSQLRTLTGLSTATIQNWVKRGWIARPQGKRYGERQVVRILLFSSLRDALALTQIADLMEWINGEVEDQADDMIPDAALYRAFCRAVWYCGERWPTEQEMQNLLQKALSDYAGPHAARQRLLSALEVMVTAFIAAVWQGKTNRAFAALSEEVKAEAGSRQGNE